MHSFLRLRLFSLEVFEQPSLQQISLENLWLALESPRSHFWYHPKLKVVPILWLPSDHLKTPTLKRLLLLPALSIKKKLPALSQTWEHEKIRIAWKKKHQHDLPYGYVFP